MLCMCHTYHLATVAKCMYIQTIGYLERERERETGINASLTFFLRRSSNPKGKFLSTGRLMAVEFESHDMSRDTQGGKEKSHDTRKGKEQVT